VLQALLRIASRLALFHVGRTVEYDLRQALFAALTRLSPTAISARPTGDLMSVLTSDVTAVRVMVGFGLLNVANTVFMTTLVLWRLLATDPALPLLALLPFPALILVGRGFGRIMHRQGRDVAEHIAAMATSAQEDFSGILTVKCLVLEAVRGRAFEHLAGD